MSRTERVSRWCWTLVSALIWTAVGGALAFLYAPISAAILSSAGGGFAGVWLGSRLSRTKWRLPVLYSFGLFFWGAVSLLTWGLQRFDFAAQLVGPNRAFGFSVVVKFFFLSFLLSTLLRASSIRKSFFLIFEGSLLTFLISKLFAGHRLGHIDRPYFLVDPLWSQGYDPLPVFMAIGAAVALLVVVLASSGVSNKRAFRDLCLAVLLIGGLYVFLPIQALNNLPKPPDFLKPDDGGTKQPAKFAESDSPNFDDRKRKRANAPMAVVLFETDYTPIQGSYYFRERAYSRIEGDRLLGEKSTQFDNDIADRLPSDKITLEQIPVEDRMGEYVNMTVCLISEHSRPLQLDQALELSPTINPDPSRFRDAYKVKSWGIDMPEKFLLSAEAGSPEWDEATRQHYLKMPDNPKYQELANEILEVVPENYQDNRVARAFFASYWLGERGTYCFHTKHAKAEDPVASFLFGDRTGYCVYFAHAACFLYRGLGTPARVVGGYAIPAENRGNGPALLIGSAYAHAWPEIYIQGIGWYPVDVAPETTLEEPIEPPDSNLQQLLGEMARNMDADQELPGMGRKLKLQEMAQEGLLALLSALPAVLLSIFLLLHLAKGRHLWLAHKGAPAKRHVTTYRALLQRLAEYGLVRNKGETRSEFSHRVGARCPTLKHLTYLHLEQTLGHKRLGTESKEYTDLYTRATAELKKEQTLWRRLMAALDPWSWSKAR
jgi:protein-glutamine gamma-glutamyltransferase